MGVLFVLFVDDSGFLSTYASVAFGVMLVVLGVRGLLRRTTTPPSDDEISMTAREAPRVAVQEDWLVNADQESVREAVRRFFEATARETTLSASAVHFRQGSQTYTRLLGGWFINGKRLPKEGWAQLEAVAASRTHVRVRVEEAFGVGLVDRTFANKYKRYMQDWMWGLRAELEESFGQVATSYLPRK